MSHEEDIFRNNPTHPPPGERIAWEQGYYQLQKKARDSAILELYLNHNHFPENTNANTTYNVGGLCTPNGSTSLLARYSSTFTDWLVRRGETGIRPITVLITIAFGAAAIIGAMYLDGVTSNKNLRMRFNVSSPMKTAFQNLSTGLCKNQSQQNILKSNLPLIVSNEYALHGHKEHALTLKNGYLSNSYIATPRLSIISQLLAHIA